MAAMTGNGLEDRLTATQGLKTEWTEPFIVRAVGSVDP